MGIGKKLTKGMIGGGVNIAHKSKMSGKAKSLMSFPGGMPGPGEYGKVENKVVGEGMMKYMAGEPVGMAKYKSNAQRKAAHASMAEQGAGKYGKHMGPEKALKGAQDKLPMELQEAIKEAPGMYGKKKKGIKQMGEMEEPPMSGGPSKYGKHKGPGNFGSGFGFSATGSDKSKKEKEEKSPMSDMEKIQSSKKAKIKAAKAKKAEGQADLKKARETKFISRGSGEDSGVSTRKERRTAIRAARKKKREGRKAERKARKGTVIKQKSVRIKKSDD